MEDICMGEFWWEIVVQELCEAFVGAAMGVFYIYGKTHHTLPYLRSLSLSCLLTYATVSLAALDTTLGG